jgi:two-component system LytT family response regulator
MNGKAMTTHSENPQLVTDSRKIRAVIVEDEELARQILREMLRAHAEVEVVGECANGFEAVKMVPELKPDLLFLDVQMPKLDGFEVLELIGNDMAVIFVTAYDEHALRAFEVHAVDYLLKPFAAQRLEAALERARLRLGQKSGPNVAELTAAARPEGRYAERVVVKDGAKVQIIPVEKLDYAEAQDDYVSLASQGRKHMKQQTISSLEGSLDPGKFLRIHRSYIVNLERVTRLEPYSKDSHVVTLTDGTRLPVSRSGYGRLRALLDQQA